MTITIGEDNGFLFGGIPSLVVVAVTFDDGRVVRFPYPADKPINALYADLAKLNNDNPMLPDDKVALDKSFILRMLAMYTETRAAGTSMELIAEAVGVFKRSLEQKKVLGGMNKSEVPFVPATAEDINRSIKQIQTMEFPESKLRKTLGVDDVPPANPTKIEKGDIVRCVFLENRNDHAGAPATIDLSVGGIYRVHKCVPQGYQVIDDNAPMKFIMFLARHEVELVEKGKPIEKKVLFIEREFNCPKCNLMIYCELHNGFFIGKCDCGQDIKISLKEANRGQGGDPNAETAQLGGASGNVQAAV